ncbi:nucleotidyltransferase domain-containing protein [Micromonospora sp. DT81.3]|uniref:nucleotidyltransferase domain-containing protein n=1 Tax=Micromonospora sp. DT81.3 TaxID=3416523 RepID=UPI003CF9D590
MEQQERALAAYIDTVREHPATLAVIVVGSVARGDERAESDVDVYLVVDDASFTAASAENRLAWIERRDADYPGSYIDIKLSSPGYLAAAAEHGDDPTRASFAGARVAYARRDASRVDESSVDGSSVDESSVDGSSVDAPDLDDLIGRITRLPDGEWEERVRSHLAQVRLHGGYFLRQAAERGDEFLLRHAALHLALAAARAAFAADRTLLQGPKYVSRTLRGVPTPEGFLEAWDDVVACPGLDTGERLMRLVEEWLGDRLDADRTLSTFIRDNELAWLRGGVPAEYY